MSDKNQIYHGVAPYIRLGRILRPESREIWVAVLYSVAIGLVTLVLPVATQALVNTVAFGVLLQPLVVLSLLVLLALLFAAVLNGFRFYVVEMIQRRFFVRMAGDVVQRLLRVRTDAFDRYHGPELVNRFLEVATVQKAGASLLVDGLSVLFQTVVAMVLLAVYHPYLLAFDVLLLVFILVVVFPLGFGAIPAAVRESKAKYGVLAWMQEIARHPIAFKTAQGAGFASARTNDLVTGYLGYRSKGFRILLRQIIGSFALQALASASLLGVGGWLVIQRQLTLGQLVAAELVVALVVNGFTKFGKHLETFYDLMAAIDKLGYLTDLEMERTGGESLPRGGQGLELRLRNVTIGYGRGPALLTDVDWMIPANARFGVAGPTGSGKSALVDVLYGMREPETGILEADGRDYRDISIAELRSQVKLVRTAEIFEGTILENLRVAAPDTDTGAARAVLARVGLLDLVASFPDGLHAKLATGGQPLSPGQRVQLELARAILASPRMIMLDEALDHLDDLPERSRLWDCLFDPSAGWTLVVVSENPEILGRCHRVFGIRGGSLVEAPLRERVLT